MVSIYNDSKVNPHACVYIPCTLYIGGGFTYTSSDFSAGISARGLLAPTMFHPRRMRKVRNIISRAHGPSVIRREA